MMLGSINKSIREGGIVWHPCQFCDRDWPFPKGFDPDEMREFMCVVCGAALIAEIQRQGGDNANL